MNSRTIRLAAAGSALAVVGALAGCSGSSDSSDASGSAQASGDTSEASIAGWTPNEGRPEGEIHVLVFSDSVAEVERAAAERFNETSDIKVVIDEGASAGVEYNTQVRTQIGTDSAPDIFMSWGSAGIQPLVDADALLPLDSFIEDDPMLQDAFLPSVFNEEVIDGSAYGIPMRGVAPEFLYYNTDVLADAGLEPPTSWEDFKSQIPVLQDAGYIPVALAGADKWPDMIWFQFLYARYLGNDAVAQGLAGDTSVWESDGSKAALAELKDLVDMGAFGSNFASQSYGGDGTAALLRNGLAAYELMGSWHYGTVKGDAESVDNLGWVAFPDFTEGDGLDGEIAGNLSNFYNVAADTRYPEAVAGFLAELYGDEFLNGQLSFGNVPPTTNAADLIAASDLDEGSKAHATFVVDLVESAPTFQLSWDQVVPASAQTASQDATADFFNGAIDDQGFIDAWNAVVTSE
ncbi:ABC transporter substrate-binding protein [Demequina salsinemoris]|uniref:ABC transporter substrate-binding protein n=1 Tax=Demequina salsinemoris TaxID=577470 RepID=UPI000B2E2E3A|nr:extracellular solute-binding protein [Demequina salsinemoris]